MADHRAVIVFDGVCNLCNTSVQQVIKHDKQHYFSFASLQGVYGQNLLKKEGLDSGDFDSFLLVENGKIFFKSTAALRVAKRLSFPYKLLYPFILVPRFIRDYIYGLVAKNRYQWFGKRESCMIPSPELQDRFIA